MSLMCTAPLGVINLKSRQSPPSFVAYGAAHRKSCCIASARSGSSLQRARFGKPADASSRRAALRCRHLRRQCSSRPHTCVAMVQSAISGHVDKTTIHPCGVLPCFEQLRIRFQSMASCTVYACRHSVETWWRTAHNSLGINFNQDREQCIRNSVMSQGRALLLQAVVVLPRIVIPQSALFFLQAFSMLLVLALACFGLQPALSSIQNWLGEGPQPPSAQAKPGLPWAVEHLVLPLACLGVLLAGSTAAEQFLLDAHVPSRLARAGRHILHFTSRARSLAALATATYIAISVKNRLLAKFASRKDVDKTTKATAGFFGQLFSILVILVAGANAVEVTLGSVLGVSSRSLLTVGGIGGLALGLAGKEIISNCFSGLMLYLTQPFGVGDWVAVMSKQSSICEGNVEEVGWYLTRLRSLGQEPVYVPNAVFSSSTVLNYSRKRHWRVMEFLEVRHADGPKIKAMVRDMRKFLKQHPKLEHESLHRRCFFHGVTATSLRIMVSVHVTTKHIDEFFAIKEDLILSLIDIIGRHGGRLATPVRSFERFEDAYMPSGFAARGPTPGTRAGQWSEGALLLESGYEYDRPSSPDMRPITPAPTVMATVLEPGSEEFTSPSNADELRDVNGHEVDHAVYAAKGSPGTVPDFVSGASETTRPGPSVAPSVNGTNNGTALGMPPSTPSLTRPSSASGSSPEPPAPSSSAAAPKTSIGTSAGAAAATPAPTSSPSSKPSSANGSSPEPSASSRPPTREGSSPIPPAAKQSAYSDSPKPPPAKKPPTLGEKIEGVISSAKPGAKAAAAAAAAAAANAVLDTFATAPEFNKAPQVAKAAALEGPSCPVDGNEQAMQAVGMTATSTSSSNSNGDTHVEGSAQAEKQPAAVSAKQVSDVAPADMPAAAASGMTASNTSNSSSSKDEAPVEAAAQSENHAPSVSAKQQSAVTVAERPSTPAVQA